MNYIERQIELDFSNKNEIQETNIVLNQNNRNSVLFHIKIYEGSKEINYLNYRNMGIVAKKPDEKCVVETTVSTNNISFSSTGIDYVLHPQILSAAGIVVMQIDLYTQGVTETIENGSKKLSTLLFSFKVAKAALRIRSETYLGQLEELIIQYGNLLNKLAALSKDADNKHGDFYQKLLSLYSDATVKHGDFYQKLLNLYSDANVKHEDFCEFIKKKMSEIEKMKQKFSDEFDDKMDDIYSNSKEKVENFLEQMLELIEEQQQILKDIQSGDFIVLSTYLKHIENENLKEQHIIKENDEYKLADGTFLLKDAKYKLAFSINHNLNANPSAMLFKVSNGAGLGGAGKVPAGGDNISEYLRYSYVDKNSMDIYLSLEYETIEIRKIDSLMYVLDFQDEVYTYQLILNI